MREKTRLRIVYAARLYNSGIKDGIALQNKIGISPSTLLRWSKTDLWKDLVGKPQTEGKGAYQPSYFRIPCERKNIPTYLRMKEQYLKLKIEEQYKISILTRHPECSVSDKTLRHWRKHWIKESQDL